MPSNSFIWLKGDGMIKLLSVFLFMIAFSNVYALNIHYNRLGNMDNWNLWVWNEEDKAPGFAISAAGKDEFGLLFKLNIGQMHFQNKRLGILPRRGQWEAKDNPERYFNEAGQKDIYVLEGDPKIYFAPPEISTKAIAAYLDKGGIIKVIFTRPVNADYIKSLNIALKEGGEKYMPESFNAAGGSDKVSKAWEVLFKNFVPSAEKAVLGKYIFETSKESISIALGSAAYDKEFIWQGELGAKIENGKTIICVFAPKAAAVSVKLKDMESGEVSYSEMTKKGNGVWEKVYPKDLTGKYYRLVTVQNGKKYEGLDPYAKCVTNDDGYAYIGNETTPVEPSPKFDLSEGIIYEVHLRDLTINEKSGAKNKGHYLGAAQSGTRHTHYPSLTTGLDHIAELGVNIVHIMPFQDFQNNDNFASYNWGYMPVNFNSPDGAYATTPLGTARITEVKKMISAFHKKGIKVIMDVVYNHTAETPNEVHNFNAMSMDYYYRLRPDGTYSNGSGCGNEFNTEAPMARRFIIDSLLYWMREYKVDGFRFDLMGLIDLEAVDEILTFLRKENPDVIIYGEPWTGGSSMTEGVSKGKQRSKGYAVFNDRMRDAIKGSVFQDKEKGYVQGGLNREGVMSGIIGAINDFADSPLESINYVSCHDNHTLWDRIMRSSSSPIADKIKMDKLANAIVMTSQGIPFLHAGEEFLRTKQGEHNSYNLPDSINQLDWDRKYEFRSVFNYYKALIALRKAHKIFRMDSAGLVRKNLIFFEDLGLELPGEGIAYTLNGAALADSWKKAAVLINPSPKTEIFPLPEGKWKMAFDESGFYKGSAKFYKTHFPAPPLSLCILVR